MYIISVAANLPDKDLTAQRLLQNQSDIGSAVAVYYGQMVGGKLTSLLRAHILIAADIVAAAKAGKTAKADSLNKKWRDNADDIANFLHVANDKNWPAAALRLAMYTHLDQTMSEATHTAQG